MRALRREGGRVVDRDPRLLPAPLPARNLRAVITPNAINHNYSGARAAPVLWRPDKPRARELCAARGYAFAYVYVHVCVCVRDLFLVGRYAFTLYCV